MSGETLEIDPAYAKFIEEEQEQLVASNTGVVNFENETNTSNAVRRRLNDEKHCSTSIDRYLADTHFYKWIPDLGGGSHGQPRKYYELLYSNYNDGVFDDMKDIFDRLAFVRDNCCSENCRRSLDPKLNALISGIESQQTCVEKLDKDASQGKMKDDEGCWEEFENTVIQFESMLPFESFQQKCIRDLSIQEDPQHPIPDLIRMAYCTCMYEKDYWNQQQNTKKALIVSATDCALSAQDLY